MDTFILSLLMATPQTGGEAGTADVWVTFLPFIAVIAIFYFLILRPQSKRRKETEKMISAIKKGDKIVTIGGLYGTIQTVKETTVVIKVDDNVKLEFLRSAISSVINHGKEEKDESEGQKSESGE
jgi:preprotein translocase subunit YajC